MARAVLDGRPLPRGVNDVNFGYTMNTQTYDTLGGRVVQLLSVRVDRLTISAHAGTRDDLLRLVDFAAVRMEMHAASELPVRLEIPSRDWFFDVWVVTMPAIRLDVQSVAYEYRMDFEVEQASDKVKQIAETRALRRIAEDIGFDPSKYTWRDSEVQSRVNELTGQVSNALTEGVNAVGIGQGGRIE